MKSSITFRFMDHHPRISSFQGKAEGKKSKKLTKRE